MVRKGCLVANAPAPLLTVAEVCQRLRLGKSKVFELVATGQLESLKIDGARRFTEEPGRRLHRPPHRRRQGAGVGR